MDGFRVLRKVLTQKEFLSFGSPESPARLLVMNAGDHEVTIEVQDPIGVPSQPGPGTGDFPLEPLRTIYVSGTKILVRPDAANVVFVVYQLMD